MPDSPLARKREERARKAADREREEQKVGRLPSSRVLLLTLSPQKLAADKLNLSSNSGGNNSGSSSNAGSEAAVHHLHPFERQTGRSFPGVEPTPALRQLSDFARPHGTMFSPGFPRTSVPTQPPTPAPGLSGFPLGSPFPHAGMDQLLHYQMAAGMQGM